VRDLSARELALEDSLVGNLIVRLRAFDDQRAAISEGASAPHGAPTLPLQNATYDEVKHG
jgi:hypothetical protein